jgi:hypothetical protein
MDTANVPKILANYIAKELRIRHDEAPKKLDKAPAVKDMAYGIIFRINNDGTAFATREKNKNYTTWEYIPKKGRRKAKIVKHYDRRISDVKKRYGAKKGNGEWYKLDSGDYRGDKPESDVDSVKDREGVGMPWKGDEGVYAYMNRAFTPRLSQKLNQYADAIYASLRDIPRGTDSYGRDKYASGRMQGAQTGREMALKAAETIEDIADGGFNRNNMHDWLQTVGKYHSGWGSHYSNEDEFAELINQPNGRAMFAKHVLTTAKNAYARVQELKMAILKNKMNPDS